MNRPAPLSTAFHVLQVTLLAVIIFISVISGPRQMLLLVSSQMNTPLEFRMIGLSIPDYFVILLVMVSAARVLLDQNYRQRLVQTTQMVIQRWGGLWWAGLVLWMVVGVLWAGDGALLRFTTLHLSFALALALVLADTARGGALRVLLLALVVSAVVQSALALLQSIGGGPLGLWDLGEIGRFTYDTSAFYRAPGLSMHPNYLGGYQMIALFASVLLIRPFVVNRRWLSLVLPALIALGLAATLSRSAMLATLVGFLPLVAALVLPADPRLRRRMIIGVIVVLVAGAALVWLLLGGNLQERIFAPREFFFTYTWEVLRNSPLLGVGAGNLMLEVGRMWGESVEHLLPVHNVYLYVWAELGLPGLVLFALACFAILRRVRGTGGWDAFIWGCCFLAICVVMIFDNYFWAVHPLRVSFFWVVGLWWGFACRSLADETASTLMQAESAVSPAIKTK